MTTEETYSEYIHTEVSPKVQSSTKQISLHYKVYPYKKDKSSSSSKFNTATLLYSDFFFLWPYFIQIHTRKMIRSKTSLGVDIL